jgi:hypothetical protein
MRMPTMQGECCASRPPAVTPVLLMHAAAGQSVQCPAACEPPEQCHAVTRRCCCSSHTHATTRRRRGALCCGAGAGGPARGQAPARYLSLLRHALHANSSAGGRWSSRCAAAAAAARHGHAGGRRRPAVHVPADGACVAGGSCTGRAACLRGRHGARVLVRLGAAGNACTASWLARAHAGLPPTAGLGARAGMPPAPPCHAAASGSSSSSSSKRRWQLRA